MNVFLAGASLQPLWRGVAAALDRNGLDWRGRLTLPGLTPEGRRRLGIVIERPVLPGRRSVVLYDLAEGVERMTDAPLVEVEARAEGIAAIDVDGGCSDQPFPRSGTTPHAALLLLDALVRRHRGGAEAS